MRLEITLSNSGSISLPLEHNHIVQSCIYNSISPELARKLHDEGFEVNKRRFRLFTFSRIMGDYNLKRDKKEIEFTSPVRLVVSSVIDKFIEEIGNEMLRKESLKLGRNKVNINSLEVSNLDLADQKYRIKMLSPVTIYSTLSKADGKKKTYYYSPFEDEFSELIAENARKKYKAYYGKDAEGKLSVKPFKVNSRNQKVISYKRTIIKGWMGLYELEGDSELISMVYDTGLGGKNAQGFGCFEIIN